jgi:hypothetical protein
VSSNETRRTDEQSHAVCDKRLIIREIVVVQHCIPYREDLHPCDCINDCVNKWIVALIESCLNR